jgi:hypothetical protein
MIHHDYTLQGKVLRSVTSARYLGVQLSHDLKWNSHISNVTAKANSTLGFLKRNLRIKERELKKKAYVSLVRPQLDGIPEAELKTTVHTEWRLLNAERQDGP